MTTQRSGRSTTVAPSLSRRRTSAGMSSVHAALVLDALDLDDRLVGRCCKHAVIAAAHRMVTVHGTAERGGPKLAASSTSAVLQSINRAHRREWCMGVSFS